METLISAVIAGDRDAWRRLAEQLSPRIDAIARAHPQLRSRGLTGSPDDLAEVGTATLERLVRNEYQNLRRFVERRAQSSGTPQSFDSWLYGAVDYTVRDHLRKRYGRAPRAAELESARPLPSKRDINSHAGGLDAMQLDPTYLQRFGMTVRLTVSEIFEYAEREFSEVESDAMHRYYRRDQDFEEIADALGLEDAVEAEKLIRRLNARLRYKFEK